ncbi:hypothetical protein U0070_020440 [Myodes glareolus]|uniref:Uncharacterized protein n=1 Tax=Myodes glareolus TaxID=447135 RepID=A0AAW0J3B9_MYOGA
MLKNGVQTVAKLIPFTMSFNMLAFVPQDHADLRSHFFTVGMKLETVNMSEPFHICPASVTKVFNNHFFQVTIDDLRPEPNKLSMLCHADSLGILPVQWCLKNGVNLTPPKGLYPVEICGVGMIQASVSLSPN